MFILKSVTLRNFRSVNDAVFKPLNEGVTGLSGLNGVGKSSFLEGMLWALFDIRGDRISVKNLRRIGADPSEECFVAVVFEHEGNTIEVIRELRGKNARAIVNIYLDGIEQTHTSVKVANQWLRDRLKIDPDGFKTAFVVRQKELDSLVRALPSERRATIERLSGIEKLSIALKKARENENIQKREVSSLPGSEDAVIAADEAVESQKSVIVDLKQRIGMHQKDVIEQEAATAQLRALADIALSTSSTREKLSSAKESLAAAETRLAAEGPIAEDVSSEDVAQVKEELATLEQQLQEAREHHTFTTTRKKSIRDEASRLSEEIHNRETIIARGKEVITEIESNQIELVEASANAQNDEAEISRLTSETSRLASENANLSNRLAKIKNILVTLRENEGNAHCPTCNSALDDIKELESTFESEIEAIHDSLSQNTQTLNALRDEESNTSTRLARTRVRIRNLQASVDQRASTETRIKEASEQVASHQARLVEIEQEDKSLEEVLAQLIVTGKALAASVSEKKEEVQSIERAFEGRTRIASLRQEKKQWEARVAELRETLNATVSEAESFDSEVPLEDASNRYNAAQAYLRTLETERDEMLSEKRVQEERLNSLERDAQREKNMFERKRVAFQNLSELAAISDTLDEFRKDRIAQIAPELSETATALISSMTSGRFTEVILDEDFTPSVVNDTGEVLMASQLSGGEESIVALALRVALGDLITGGVGGLLWLDEVLTAQDAARRSSLMNTLSHIAGRQIVLISHTPESTDSVDKIVHLVATDDGSFLADE